METPHYIHIVLYHPDFRFFYKRKWIYHIAYNKNIILLNRTCFHHYGVLNCTLMCCIFQRFYTASFYHNTMQYFDIHRSVLSTEELLKYSIAFVLHHVEITYTNLVNCRTIIRLILQNNQITFVNCLLEFSTLFVQIT